MSENSNFGQNLTPGFPYAQQPLCIMRICSTGIRITPFCKRFAKQFLRFNWFKDIFLTRNHYKRLNLFHFCNIVVYETYFEYHVLRENSIRNKLHKSCDIFLLQSLVIQNWNQCLFYICCWQKVSLKQFLTATRYQ